MPTETRLDISPAGSLGLLGIQDPSAAQSPKWTVVRVRGVLGRPCGGGVRGLWHKCSINSY